MTSSCSPVAPSPRSSAFRAVAALALAGSSFACDGAMPSPSSPSSGSDGSAAPSGSSGEADSGASAEAGDGAGSARDAAASSAAGNPVRTLDFVPGVTVTTVAGSDVRGTRDGTGAAAQFDNPTGIALDKNGDLLVTDYDSALVRLVTPRGAVTTIASGGYSFVTPFAAAVATDGTYYVETDADSSGVKGDLTGTIWRVTPIHGVGIATPVVVVEGLARPRGLAPIAGGDLFVTERVRATVATLSVATASVFLVAGTAGEPGFRDGPGTAAEFDSPLGVATLPDGSWVVGDMKNNRIRHVTPDGVVTTLAGDGQAALNDGASSTAEFGSPGAIAVDAAGNVYVSDTGNHRIRRISVSGKVETLAGDGQKGFADGAGDVAEFYGAEGLAVTPDGKTLYVADGNSGDRSAYHRIRAISIP